MPGPGPGPGGQVKEKKEKGFKGNVQIEHKPAAGDVPARLFQFHTLLILLSSSNPAAVQQLGRHGALRKGRQDQTENPLLNRRL